MASLAAKPGPRPANPQFSSGPCTKRPGWTLDGLSGAFLGRSHRAKDPKARLAEVIDRSKAILGLPEGWRLGIVPASDTGAVEMALWSLLGARFGHTRDNVISMQVVLPTGEIAEIGEGGGRKLRRSSTAFNLKQLFTGHQGTLGITTEATLELALPLLEKAAGGPVEGIVGDPEPLAAIQDAINLQGFDEIIVSTLPKRFSRWLRLDLPHKAAGLGLPVAVPETPTAPPVALRPRRLVHKQRAGAGVAVLNHVPWVEDVRTFVATARAEGLTMPVVASVPVFTDARSAAALAALPGLELDPARVEAVEYLGTSQVVTLAAPHGTLRARVAAGLRAREGEAVTVSFQPAALSLFDAGTGRALRLRREAGHG